MFKLLIIFALLTLSKELMAETPPKDAKQHLERTCFQNSGAYDPAIDIKSDVAIVYGINPSLSERVDSWRKEGYIIHVMTGIAWGGYGDFLDGLWDGTNHRDHAQKRRDSTEILHGRHMPYMCPSEAFANYLAENAKAAVAAGAEALHLEEPEYWASAGYSECFKREWKSYYNEEWQPPHSSPDAQYKASKLKYFLYKRALGLVFDNVKEYAKSLGRDLKCYVATHSLINYASWKIVSPEHSLTTLPGCDGYIGQVWTGTARHPNYYRGVRKERTFETAFLEYGSLNNLVRSTGKRMWFLHDPIEDNPNHTWSDYRQNWESTVVASLLWPDIWRYEVMPWPSRIFHGKYPADEPAPNRHRGKKDLESNRVGLPKDYATEILIVINELNNMDQRELSWECGTKGIGIFVSDTMMFQRSDPHPSDDRLGSFFGLAMPLLKAGSPVEPVQLENATLKGYLDRYKVIFLTYEGMKPPSPELHGALAEWVKNGGILVFVDDDKDPYNQVAEWWNTPPRSYFAPREHLFEILGVAAEGVTKTGSGVVIYYKASPAALSREHGGADKVIALAKEACTLANIEWKESNFLMLKRGPYIIAAYLDETPGEVPLLLEGKYVDLFSPKLAVLTKVELKPNDRVFLLDLAKFDSKHPQVLASASKITGVRQKDGVLEFYSEGPLGVTCATRVLLPSKPSKALENGQKNVNFSWDEKTSTALLSYENSPNGKLIEIHY